MKADQHQSAAPAGTGPNETIRATTPVSLLALIPHLLGFHPDSSLVIIGTGPPPHKVRVTLRYDLPNPTDSWTASDITSHATGILANEDCSRAVVVGYGPSNLVDPVVAELREVAPSAGVTLPEVLRAEHGRYWSYLCRSPDCCPEGGTPFDPNASPVTAALAASGSRVLASREVLAATIAAFSGKPAASMRRATQRAEARAYRLAAETSRTGTRHALATAGSKTMSEAILRYRSGGELHPGAEAAWLTLLLRDWHVRDNAWAQMVPEHCTAHQKLWTDLTRLARPGYVAAPASLLAFVAWESGNGALANVALDRAIADDPAYTLAHSLQQAISSGASPGAARSFVSKLGKIVASYDQIGY